MRSQTEVAAAIRPWSSFGIFVPVIGAAAGCSAYLNRVAAAGSFDLGKGGLARVVFSAVLGAGLLWLLERLISAAVGRWLLPPEALPRFRRVHAFTYLVFALFVLGAFGLRVDNRACEFGILLLFFIVNIAALPLALDVSTRTKLFSSLGWLVTLFFISGIAALIYQVTWQRVLFGAFGVNIESVTLIVVIFMFGLGLGSLLGGAVSKRYPTRLPVFFLLCETLTGLFGVISLPLIRVVAAGTVQGGTLAIALSIFGLLSIPTLLMGATLPILVTHLHAHYRHAGKSIGLLYFANTLGSAAACFIAADILFVLAGQQLSVLFAAACNLAVGLLVWKHTRAVASRSQSVTRQPEPETEAASQPPGASIPFPVVLLLAGLIGYVSLSQEILWIHGLSFSTGGVPRVFAHVLGIFLLGIAGGSLYAKKKTESSPRYPGGFLVAALIVSGLVYFAATPVSAWLSMHREALGFRWLYLSVLVVAFLSGLTFPILCHFGISRDRGIGSSLSWVYFANIVGSMLGPVITTYLLMDVYSLSQLNLFAALLTFACAGLVALLTPVTRRERLVSLVALVTASAVVLLLQPASSVELLRRLQFKDQLSAHAPYERVVENRSGIITIEQSQDGAIIYGDGIYDGRFNVDPVLDSNLISRCYMISALHRNPERVLEIGLSSGSWTRVMAAYDPIKTLDVVEINPGYAEAVRQSDNASVLTNPKVHIYFDDGRRWLKRHPEKKYDLIVMNTSYYWRSHATNILSQDFLRMVRSHLNPGGVVYYNGTGFPDNVYTAAKTFPHVLQVVNFIAASDASFDLTTTERAANLERFTEGGQAIFSRSPAMGKRAVELATWSLSDVGPAFRERSDLWVITDDNMASEFRAGLRFYEPARGWAGLLSRPGS
jgi:predicted membrane-bound spermidine synthase